MERRAVRKSPAAADLYVPGRNEAAMVRGIFERPKKRSVERRKGAELRRTK
jgi:hypothetical protein